MVIDFDEETPAGSVNFTGELKKEEVDFLLRYALLSLLSRGLLPAAIVAKFPDDAGGDLDDTPPNPDKDKLN